MKRDIEFKAAFYILEDKSLICPHSSVQPGDLVMGLYPLQKIDPKNRYAFVVTPNGSETVSRKFLRREGGVITLRLAHVQYEAANDLKKRMVEAMYQRLRDELTELIKDCDWLNEI